MLLEKVPRSYVLALVTNALPPHSSLTSLELRVQRVSYKNRVAGRGAKRAASAKAFRKTTPDAPATIIEATITGLAATDVEVAKIIANLSGNLLTDSVDLVYSQEQMVDALPVRQFQVKLTLKPDADVLEVLGPPARPQAPLSRMVAQFKEMVGS